MRKLLIILTIIFLTTPLAKAQSSLNIDLNSIDTNISNELITLSIDLNELSNLENLTAMNSQPIVDIRGNNDYSYNTTETTQNSDVFNKLSKVKGVDVVYISKAMLGMMPSMNMPGVNIGNVAGKLESLEIYTTESASATKALLSISKSFLNSDNYETLMLVKDEGSKTAFYIKKTNTDKASEMLMVTEDDGEATIIRFLGNFSIQDLKNITNQNNGNKSSKYNSSSSLERAKAAEERAKKAEERARRAEERARRAEERARQK